MNEIVLTGIAPSRVRGISSTGDRRVLVLHGAIICHAGAGSHEKHSTTGFGHARAGCSGSWSTLGHAGHVESGSSWRWSTECHPVVTSSSSSQSTADTGHAVAGSSRSWSTMDHSSYAWPGASENRSTAGRVHFGSRSLAKSRATAEQNHSAGSKTSKTENWSPLNWTQSGSASSSSWEEATTHQKSSQAGPVTSKVQATLDKPLSVVSREKQTQTDRTQGSAGNPLYAWDLLWIKSPAMLGSLLGRVGYHGQTDGKQDHRAHP